MALVKLPLIRKPDLRIRGKKNTQVFGSHRLLADNCEGLMWDVYL